MSEDVKDEVVCPHCHQDIADFVREETKKISHPYQWWGGRTYAQHGDDLVILNIFHRLKIAKPSYLDVGAHDPFVLSNTALLYKRGSRGINVEANTNLIRAFYQHRPDDINVNIGVAPEKGIMKFYFDTLVSGRNSFIKDMVEDLGIVQEEYLSVTTLWSIVEDYANGQFPDFFSIDAEGLDYAILKTIPFEISKPKVICVEIVGGTANKKEIMDLLGEKGFFPYCWAGSNLFFIQNELRDLMY